MEWGCQELFVDEQFSLCDIPQNTSLTLLSSNKPSTGTSTCRPTHYCSIPSTGVDLCILTSCRDDGDDTSWNTWKEQITVPIGGFAIWNNLLFKTLDIFRTTSALSRLQRMTQVLALVQCYSLSSWWRTSSYFSLWNHSIAWLWPNKPKFSR